LYSVKANLKLLTGYEPGDYIDSTTFTGAIVECLVPIGDVFIDLGIDPEVKKEEFEVTAYGDGCSITGYIDKPNEYTTIEVYASCGNEDYMGDR
jgi:hypothetical protein